MNPEKDTTYIRIHKKSLVVVVALSLLAIAGLLALWVNRPSTSEQNNIQSTVNDTTSSLEMSELVVYELPLGWQQSSCEGAGGVFVTPTGMTADCRMNPAAPVRISLDAANTTDCNQLQNVSDVKKHVCVSLYINGLRSLKASTEYLETSSYNKATTINRYYIDTGKGIVKAEYIYSSDNQYQAGFEQLVNTIKVKN